MVDLLFKDSPRVGSPVDLIFGLTEAPTIPQVFATLAGAFSPLTFAARTGSKEKATLTGVFAPLTLTSLAKYDSNTARPTVGQVAQYWQIATHGEVGVQNSMQLAVSSPLGRQGRWQRANAVLSATSALHKASLRVSTQRSNVYQQALRVPPSERTVRFDNTDRSSRQSLSTQFQSGLRRQSDLLTIPLQGAIHDRRTQIAARWQTAIPLEVGVTGKAGVGQRRNVGWTSRFQEAMQPIPGAYMPPVTPPVDQRCYIPDPNLLFANPWVADGNLLFYCVRSVVVPPTPGETVVVPIRRVYMVFNNATLRRIDGNIFIPTFDMTLGIDADSWTWGISASLPAEQLANIEPSSAGDPVDIEITVNGVAYRALVESISRERQFGQATIRIGCRGRSALLDAPYSPVQTFGHSIDRTAQQLMNDVLTTNNVSLGWAVNWSPVDWLVPANVFGHQGTYMSALNQIAAAAGAYVQPHATDKAVNVLLKYPEAPWNWATAITPDYQLPAAVTTRESITWQEKARYNRVYVSGSGAGVLGQVSRAGTLGNVVAPMVTDALITQAAAARQRGIPVLSNTGRMADIRLSLPVLAETGIIMPGKFVDFVDGAVTRRGIVRGVQVSVGMPEIFQTIAVETHINA